MKQGAELLEIRPAQRLSSTLSERHLKVTFTLSLSGGEDSMWNGFKSKQRNHIKKAIKSGLSVKIGGCELLNDFYSVFSVNMRDLGSPVMPRRFFELILETFPQNARTAIVSKDGITMGGAVFLNFRGSAEAPWTSCLRKHVTLCPNYILYWEMLKQLATEGTEMFDFGRSSPDSGTCTFKKNWGAVERPIYWYYHPKGADAKSGFSSEAAKHSTAVRIWKKLPVCIANAIGPFIIRNIP